MSNRTFKPRRRRMSPTRARRFEELAPRWVIADHEAGTASQAETPSADEPFAFDELFGNTNPVVLDIGIGRGESCVEIAAADAGTNIIGADPHTPGIASALLAIDERGLTNLRLIHGDVLDEVGRIPARSLAGLRIFFPDPWPKARHHRRRIVTTERMDRLVPLVADGGFVHLATDIADYAESMEEVCGSRADLEGGRIERPDGRPLTRYEQRGLDAGRDITDLWYQVSTSGV